MNTRIPPEAFTAYYALGPSRSYELLAQKFGVSKRAVTKLAAKERWQERLAELERKAMERTEQKILESLEDMNERHLVAMKFLQRKALSALQTMPLTTAMEAVRTLAISVDKERVIRGEPADRSALDVEQIIKREYALLMTSDEDEGGGDGRAQASQ